MARARNIKPSLFKNELLGQADPLLTILFTSLWCLADKAGRLEDRPLRIKAETFPYRENIDINGYLTELQRLGFILRYKVSNEYFIQVAKFSKHQTPHSTEKASVIPEYDEKYSIESTTSENNVKEPLNNESCSVNGHINVLIPDSLNTDSNILIPDSLIADSSAEKKSAPSKKGHQLPNDWKLPKAWGDWALSDRPEFTVEQIKRIAESFRDHWIANANQANAKKSDWEAAWRNWFRKQHTPNGNGFKTKFQHVKENNDKAFSEFLGGSTEKTIEGEFSHD
jgi:hypothetical protein